MKLMVHLSRTGRRFFLNLLDFFLGFVAGFLIQKYLQTSFTLKGVPGPSNFCKDLNEGIERNIFIVRKESTSKDHHCLNFVETCALESAARAHPKMSILIQNHSSSSTPCPMFDTILKHYPNIQIDDQNDHSSSKVFDKCVKRLQQHGGICLSSHVLTLRPLNCLNNLLGHNDPTGKESVIQSGVMIFDADHPFLNHIIQHNYMKDYHVPNGLTEAFRSFCNYSGNVLPFFQDFSCANDSNIALLTSEFLHPFTSWEASNSKLFFGPMVDQERLNRLEPSFAVNLYRSPSFDDSISLSEQSLFANLAYSFCPLVYSNLVYK